MKKLCMKTDFLQVLHLDSLKDYFLLEEGLLFVTVFDVRTKLCFTEKF